MSYSHVIVEADGGSRGNPGPASYGALVRDPSTGAVIVQKGVTIGVATGLQLGLPAGERLGAGAQIELDRLCGLQLLHHLELGVLQVGDPPVQRPDLVLQVLQILRRGDLAGVDALLVPRLPLTDLIDIGVGLLLLPLQVADLGVGGDQVAVDHGLLRGQVRKGLVLGQRFALVRDLIQLQVEILQVQQPALDGGLGVQSRLLRSFS